MNSLNRRLFLGFAAAAASKVTGEERPPVVRPRATDGDTRFEPNWDERLTLTVGNRRGDLNGDDDRVIQAAIDSVACRGGGTVQLLNGTWTLRSSIQLPSGLRLRGAGSDTVLTRGPSESVLLSADSDWYDQEITLQQPGAFRIGDSVTLFAKNSHNGSQIVIKRRLMARSGLRFKLNDGLRENLWLSGEPRCTSLFPLLTSEHTADVLIENLTLDGNRANCENLNGNYGGGIFLQDCNRYTIQGLTVRNYNGDGVSFQICHDVIVQNCHSHDNADLGVHPGSGSQRPVIRKNRLERNSQGLFWCWGVKYGLAEDNIIDGNRLYGMSIGHNDTDNVIRRNRISNSGKIGLLFRDDPRGDDFWANRNVIEHNEITNSGGVDGVGIDITGQTKNLTITDNRIDETRAPEQRIGVRIGADAGVVRLARNTINGCHASMVDLRSDDSRA